MPLSASRQISVSDPEQSFNDAWDCLRYLGSAPVGDVQWFSSAKAFSTTLHMSESNESGDSYEFSDNVYAVLTYATNPDGTSATMEISDFRNNYTHCNTNFINVDTDGNGTTELAVDPWDPVRCSDSSYGGVDADYAEWYENKANRQLSVVAECMMRKQERREKTEEQKAGTAK